MCRRRQTSPAASSYNETLSGHSHIDHAFSPIPHYPTTKYVGKLSCDAWKISAKITHCTQNTHNGRDYCSIIMTMKQQVIDTLPGPLTHSTIQQQILSYNVRIFPKPVVQLKNATLRGDFNLPNTFQGKCCTSPV